MAETNYDILNSNLHPNIGGGTPQICLYCEKQYLWTASNLNEQTIW